MWLLLVAAGTGYLARCWQKTRKFKTGPHIFMHNAALNGSQRSPSCSPRRGRSTTRSRGCLCKRYQSARGISRKFLHGRKEGRLASTHARGSDENLGSPNKLFDDTVCDEDFLGQSAFGYGSPGQMENSSLLWWLHRKHHLGPFLSLGTGCAQDHLRELSVGAERPLLSSAEVDAKEEHHLLPCDCAPPRETSEMGSWKNLLNFAKATENASSVSAATTKGVPVVSACPEFLRFKTMGEERRESLPLKLKESTEQAFDFFSKVAKVFRMRRNPSLKPTLSLNTRDASLFKDLTYGKPFNRVLIENNKRKQGFGPHIIQSQHLKALLDPEFSDQCQRCHYLFCSSSSYELEKVKAYATDFAGLSKATHRTLAQVHRNINDWDHSMEKASESAKLMHPSKSQALCFRENCFQISNGVSFVALGLAMGVLLVATGCGTGLEDLHKLLKKNNFMIEELKKKFDARFELDPSKLPEVEKVPSILTVVGGTRSPKVPLHPDISSCQSAGERDSLKLFNASTRHEASEFLESHAHGFDDLEAELEAELELMELNGCGTDMAEHEWKQAQLTEGCQLEEDDTSYVDIDVHDFNAVEDAGQLYESDFVVPPLELERRLWQVLEQRHEERIYELENDLQAAEKKVTAKEIEIQWWKDRVWWLMETSLGGESKSPNSLCSNQIQEYSGVNP